MTSELTERYVAAVTRILPPAQRAAGESELRASLQAMVNHRVADGADALSAERGALTELGDPDRRAAQSANRPPHLIGPALFFDYLRLLKRLMSIVVPIAAIAVFLAQLLSGSDIAESIAAALVAAFEVAIQIAVWVTVVFAILERTSIGEKFRAPWTPDRLPKLPNRSPISVTETVIGAAGLLVFAAAIGWQQFSSFFLSGAGTPIPLLTPALWSWWLPYFLLLIALQIGFLFVNLAQGRWTWRTAVVNAGLVSLFTAPALWLLSEERLLNPDFLSALKLETTLQLQSPDFAVILTIAVLGLSAWNVIDGFLKARHAMRVSPPLA
ncbi:hypothetical protein I6E81_09145 [Salinibacterium sp. NG22]|uniref:hypothetical protein n=1 Tax=Salinibacterium sp. NG22 TaxID=2792040 RepID=UPI0018CF9C8A|nr:hypothetical protein [Salinibacterium sp. NG22]MBH0110332.1 hypothetical protein [Salinibacterium sp. NG22]